MYRGEMYLGNEQLGILQFWLFIEDGSRKDGNGIETYY